MHLPPALGQTIEFESQRKFDVIEEVYSSPNNGRFLYKVKSAEDGLIYALKLFDTSCNDIRSIKKEMIALNNQNQHPHLLPRFRGSFHRGNHLALLMDWMVGSAFSKVTGNLPVTTARDVVFRMNMLMALCDTASYLHDARYWHRDLKPENVMLRDTRNPQQGVVVIDLGQTAEKRGASEGTCGYFAPEQYAKRNYSLGPWTDIFSMAQIGWFLLLANPLALYPEYGCDRWTTNYSGILSQELPQIPKLDALENILLRCLSFKPENRLSKAKHFKSEIHNALRALGH